MSARQKYSEVVIAIVNYCTPGLVADCLRSLAMERGHGRPFDVVVADNASPDGSAATLEASVAAEGWQDWVRVLPLPENGGFAYGNNAVFRQCLERASPPRYVWLLNSDTYVRPGALDALLSVIERDSANGIVGSRVEFPDATPQSSVFRFHSIASDFEAAARTGPVTRLLERWRVAPDNPGTATRVDWVCGASMLVRTDALRDVGLMDEGYFLYFEETDFCLQASRKGWQCWFAPESRVVHLVGRSTTTDTASTAKRRPGYWYQSRRRYFVKNHGRVYAAMADAAMAAGSLLWWMRARATGRPTELPRWFFVDLFRHSTGFGQYDFRQATGHGSRR